MDRKLKLPFYDISPMSLITADMNTLIAYSTAMQMNCHEFSFYNGKYYCTLECFSWKLRNV